MRIIEFSDSEKDLIKESIDLRLTNSKKNIGFYKGHISELNEILRRIDSFYVTLTPMQKAILTGCIREKVIYPNENILNLTDFQLLSIYESFKEKIEYIDTSLNILNKIQNKKEPKTETFESRITKIHSILKIREVYYSVTDNGMIYHVGLLSGENKGIHINLKGALISNFNISKLNRKYYMKSAKPEEIIEAINISESDKRFTENYNRLLIILENASV